MSSIRAVTMSSTSLRNVVFQQRSRFVATRQLSSRFMSSSARPTTTTSSSSSSSLFRGYKRPFSSSLTALQSSRTMNRVQARMSKVPEFVPPMFCFQCEQTREGTGCSTDAGGVCGKTPEVANLQDLLIHAIKGISVYAHAARQLGGSDPALDAWLNDAMFSTLTNVNFDGARFVVYLKEASAFKEKAKALYERSGGSADLTINNPAAQWSFVEGSTEATLAEEGQLHGVINRKAQLGNDDLFGMQEFATYGMKGMMAYAAHAHALGKVHPEVTAFTTEVFAALTDPRPTMEGLLKTAMSVGAMNLKVMEILEDGHTSAFGHPVPTPVLTTPTEGKAILVSGHDLVELKAILEQTEGTGINVYTHGEMLPGHGYPDLKKHAHLKGNYGGAWMLQKSEFAKFPGPIVMTSNCIVEPRKKYADRIYTRCMSGFPGVKHLDTADYSAVVQHALDQPGFSGEDVTDAGPEKTVLTGCGKNAVLSMADKVVAAIKSGDVKHFFLIGGCDGAEGERSYFTDVATSVPDDSVILTLACGKYRFNKLEFGDIGGIPRLLDVGQCNDAYGAIQIAATLAKAFETDVNGLPLSFVVSWFEQKAVAILLTLLNLGVKNIRLGPNLPAFATPNMLNLLVNEYGVKPINTDDVPGEVKLMLSGN
eukprot:TRINITY_DN6572_c0_g2_i1.p1 TRINITY_DN6572_c0_g2~~TRINITY_DN6572_c0_g2_i1.p1  ORF type:complete len:680 (+),score=190.68 TRINITY_DN6572_c0_g2_i1:88-2040(+)